MRKNEWSSVLALAHFVLPVFLVRYGKVIFSGTVRRKVVLSVVIVLFYFLVPGLILLSRWLWNLGVRVEQISFVATKVFVLGWFKPIVLVEGLGEFKIQLLNLIIFSVLLLALNLLSLRFVPKNYSQVIAGIMKDFVPGFSTATKMKASQVGNVVTVKTDAFADIWTLYGNKEKVENRLSDRVRIVELTNPETGVFEFVLGELKITRTRTGTLKSSLGWKECPQIDARKDVTGLWTVNIGSNGKSVLVDLSTSPNLLFTGPPGYGKSTAILHLMSAIARQNSQAVFVIVNMSKPSDHASLEKDYYAMAGLLPGGGKDQRMNGMSDIERFKAARKLDNFILFRTEAELGGLVRWLDNELLRRNEILEETPGASHIYQLAAMGSERVQDKTQTKRELMIVVNICEYTILREKFGEKGNDVAEALNRIETIGLEGRNRGIHIVVDSQDATLKVVGYLRRSSTTTMFGVTSSEIEFVFNVKTQPVRGIGVAVTSDVRGIKTICSPWIEWHEASKHITDAERMLTTENRRHAQGLRKSVRHESGENDQELMIDGQAAVLET